LKVAVIYASKSGNTKKIADAIAQQIGTHAHNIGINTQSPSVEGANLVFIGTGIHAGTPNSDIEKYLTNLNLKEPKQFALFVTWGGAGKTNQQVKTKLQTILEIKGHKVLRDYFICYGGWKLLRRGRPNSDDIKAASEWAKKILSQLQK
jgi:flavodoxin